MAASTQQLFDFFRSRYMDLFSRIDPGGMSVILQTTQYIDDDVMEKIEERMEKLWHAYNKLMSDLQGKIRWHDCRQYWDCSGLNCLSTDVTAVFVCDDYKRELDRLNETGQELRNAGNEVTRLSASLDIDMERPPSSPAHAAVMEEAEQRRQSFAAWLEQVSQKTGVRKEILFAMLGAVALVVVFMLFRGKKS